MSDLGWAPSLLLLLGVLFLLCCLVVAWPRKPRGLARPVRDSRSSLELFRRMGSQR